MHGRTGGCNREVSCSSIRQRQAGCQEVRSLCTDNVMSSHRALPRVNITNIWVACTATPCPQRCVDAWVPHIIYLTHLAALPGQALATNDRCTGGDFLATTAQQAPSIQLHLIKGSPKDRQSDDQPCVLGNRLVRPAWCWKPQREPAEQHMLWHPRDCDPCALASKHHRHVEACC
jgi:hypothetical protein